MERILTFFRKTAFVVLVSFFTTNIAMADTYYEEYYFNASGGCYLPCEVKKVKRCHHHKKPKKRCAKHYKPCCKPCCPRPVIIMYPSCDPCASGCSYCVRDFSYKRGRNCSTVEICIDGGDPYMY